MDGGQLVKIAVGGIVGLIVFPIVWGIIGSAFGDLGVNLTEQQQKLLGVIIGAWVAASDNRGY
ncbi:MAG: hypothetical protein QXP91_10635 [Candidatus Methanomethylicia archaeon]